MSIVIQKFGGNLVKDFALREKAISHIEHALHQGHQVLVVVSAMGRKGECYATDTLLENAEFLSSKEKARLLAFGEIMSGLILSNQLQSRGISTYALAAHELGILTTSNYEDALPIGVDSYHIVKGFSNYSVCVVPGFIGTNNFGELTTLGRGGSDLTAVLLAQALGLWEVQIFKETQGIRSADPRVVDTTLFRPNLSYYQMIQLSHYGAKILQKKAVEEAWKKGIQIKVIPFEGDFEETSIISEIPSKEKWIAITHHKEQVFILGHLDEPTLTTFEKQMTPENLVVLEDGLTFIEKNDVATTIRNVHHLFFE